MSSEEAVRALRDPPKTFLGSFRFLGPGLILSAAIVGSGELIMTTALGAKAGFALLWVILFGCLIKVGVQLEFGRHCICHGIPTFQAWNAGKGPRIYSLHWSVYAGFFYIVSILIGQAGVVGGAAQVAAYAFPAVNVNVWCMIIAVLLALLVFHGRYGPIELLCMLLNVGFVLVIIFCVAAVQWTPYAISLGDLSSGFTVRFPAGTLALAAAAFGITGVSAGEIFAYPYWCVEKGYGAWTGPQDDTDAWAARARGWIRVMTIDALVSMVVYTVATAGFYILGAAVLHAQAELADGNALILQLSRILTEVLGEKAMAVFMLGAFFVLFSTAFSNTAAHSRMWADFFGVCRVYDADNIAQRRRCIAIMAWVLPAIWSSVYMLHARPLFLVAVMGISSSVFLLVVAYQALVYRYRYTDPRVAPPRWYDALLWGSVTSIGFLAARYVAALFG